MGVVETSKLLRGGRITSVRKDVIRYTSSMKSDQRLLKSVIEINQAHVAMIMEQRIIKWSDGVLLLRALGELKSGMKFNSSSEDAHMAVEEEVIKKVGPEIGGNLHVAKSRNDQVSTALRMELRQNIVDLIASLMRLQEALIKLAGKHVRTIVPGYTHLQPAQPVTFAHYLLSYVDMLKRNLQRLEESYKRINLCPMGAGALATSSFPINRERVAQLLGFSEVLENSIDAVSSRDFALETLSNLTIIAVDISRLAEDLIIWSSANFEIVELPNGFASTSSIMPQKKNPDVLEVIRARVSHVLGNFVASATILKALPSSYNLDLQEITPKLWESLGNVTDSLDMLFKLITKLKVSKNAFANPILSFTASTELANMLVRKHKVPFRIAHKIVGSLTNVLIEQRLTLPKVTPELLQNVVQDSSGLSVKISLEDIRESTDPLRLVESHNVIGGPSPAEVKRMLGIRKEWTVISRSNLSEKKKKLKEAEDILQSLVESYLSSENQSITKLKSLKE